MNTVTLADDINTLQAQHDEASAIFTALTQEEAGLPGAIRAAAEAGNADEFVRLKARLAEMSDRLKVARLAYAKTGLAWAKASYAALTARDMAAIESGPAIHQTDNGGLWNVGRPSDTSQALLKFESFQSALTQAQREIR